MTEKFRVLIVPTIVSVATTLIALLGLSNGMDWKAYDLMLHVRRAPEEYPYILLTDFDEAAVLDLGTWPIGRDIVAEGLVTMGELGAAQAVFDIEYVDKSPRGVDARYLEEEIPESFDEGFGSVAENIQNLFSALETGSIPLSDAGDYVGDLVQYTDYLKEELITQVGKVAADNDEKLGRAARLFGNAYFTINRRGELELGNTDEKRRGAMEIAGNPIEPGTEEFYLEAVDILPTIAPILSQSAGAGFPNVYVDEDGIRRRIDLFYRYGDKRIAQLVLAPLLDMMGSPEVKVSGETILLKEAKLPWGEQKDIRIPRTEDGRMLINWPHEEYFESFKHISYNEFLRHEKQFENLAHNLRIRDDWGYLDGYDGNLSLAELFAEVQRQRREWMEGSETPPEDALAQLRQYRDYALDEAEAFFSQRPEDYIIEQVQQVLAMEDIPQDLRDQYQMILDDAPEYFEKTRVILTDLREYRRRLTELVDGTFCIIGFVATGTTDIGVNPFVGEYVNVGTHAAVLNTILQRSFLDDVPAWIPILLSAAGAFGLALLINGRKPVIEIAIGLPFTILLGFFIVLFFIITGIFIPPVQPLVTGFITFLAATITSFLRTEREKGYIRNAFSHYLSTDVIKEIINDPNKLKLGGTKKHMTAMFTDIRGFSTISEKLTPEDLVHLLNQYLSKMSDVVLDLKGTIDKYEGDAIIAFFGAPLDLSDHAERACKAAAAMKRVEAELNQQFLANGVAPSPLLTRIGLNTGDMVVGNMGTDRKMDYTIIGDAVNLAARLEGVNKQYGTWICVSEDTFSVAGASFLFRRLDRIRVVGKSTPIRILELVDERTALSKEDITFYEGFEEALEVFEERNWAKAAKLFSAQLKMKKDDGPSQLYLGRCKNYIEKPPLEDWDGVFNLTSK